jgi:hypothetical protein
MLNTRKQKEAAMIDWCARGVRVFAVCSAVVLGANAWAQSGTWTESISKSGEFVHSSTLNDSGSFLGQFCYPANGKCMWLVGLKSRCTKGKRYPVLASGEGGASHVTMLCAGKKRIGEVEYSRYVLSKFKSIDKMVRSGARIGFALPMGSGRFRVVRFATTGAASSIDAMRRVAAEMRGKKGSNDDLKDEEYL